MTTYLRMAVHANKRLQGVHTILQTSESCGGEHIKMIFSTKVSVHQSSPVIVN